MVFGKTKRSRALFASVLCAAAIGCATDEPQQQTYQPGPGPGAQPGGGTTGGSPVVAGDAGGFVPPGNPGGGTTGGVAGGGTTGAGGGTTGAGGGTTGAGGGTTGPVDLGMNSQGDTFLRADTLLLKSPHLYEALLGTDITPTAQGMINDYIGKDGNGDGLVDVSLLVRFLQSANPSAANGQVTIGGGRCPLPGSPQTACGPEALFPFQSPAVPYTNGQNCPLIDTQEVAAGACVATSRTSLTINVPLLGAIPLQDGQVIGTWQNGTIIGGKVRGFLSRAVAATINVPQGLPVEFQLFITPGQSITQLLKETEQATNARGEQGWWWLIEFTAQPTTFNPALPAM